MISYPFFGDQPGMAARCRELGLAVPLATAPRERSPRSGLTPPLAELSASAGAMRARLAEAREWERRVIADRDSVLDRISALAAG